MRGVAAGILRLGIRGVRSGPRTGRPSGTGAAVGLETTILPPEPEIVKSQSLKNLMTLPSTGSLTMLAVRFHCGRPRRNLATLANDI